MMMSEKSSPRRIKLVPPDDIRPNPENPRLAFRAEEMDSLVVSISRNGVQVPVTVYEDDGGYTLIDGERRWRCARKLNLLHIPALIQEKPTPLQNLILMYNIHALREQWDYFTIASKLQRIIDLFCEERGWRPNEIELSEETGLTRGQIRRCQSLLGLPDEFKQMLLEELELPKAQQKLSEDFFIEMEKSLKTVTKRLPDFGPRINEIRETLVDKYRRGVISAVTDFRQLSKIATAIDNLGWKKQKAERTLSDIFDPDKTVSIRKAYADSVEFEYDERKAARQISFLSKYFDDLIEENKANLLEDEFREQLRQLLKRLKRLLEG